MFIDGPAGRGKTMLARAILSYTRSRREVTLVCATTGLAAMLYKGGRTAHTMFGMPIVEGMQDSVHSNISPADGKDSRVQLIRAARIIVWDEIASADKILIEGVDALLREIMEVDEPFGGKLLIGVGDFRQLPPVVRFAKEAQVINASLRSSCARVCGMRSQDKCRDTSTERCSLFA